VPPTDPIQLPDLADALVRLADSLDRRSDDDGASHLDMAVLADSIARQLHGLAALLVARARSDGATWAEVGGAFGVTRQAALRRWRST
jgi:hypothetical protein